MAESYEVKEGDTLPSIAVDKGYRSWETIWLHGSNAELRKQRENPGVLNPGDKLTLPDKEPKDFSCETNQKHTFRVKGIAAYLELMLEDEAGKAFANAAYKVEIEGAAAIEGSTDEDGYFKAAIPPKAKKAKLTVTPASSDKREPMEWTLKLGHMDPVSENTGVQAILNNLGYDAGAENDGTIDEQFKAALMAFQSDNDLEPTGEIDDDTRSLLEG